MKNFSSLQVFCAYIVRKYGGLEGISEEQMSEEFRNVYLKGLPLNLRTLRAVSASCGIELNGLEKMPANMRGYHEVYGENKSIYFRNSDTSSGIQNTILHEIREMMDTLFVEVNPGYVPLKTTARHIAANKFASAVLLPQESFLGKVYQTGMDVIALSRLYSKSCSQVLLRMGEVLQGKLFFYAALYEPDPDNETGWKVSYRTVSYNEEDPDANFRGVDGFLPRKGRPVLPDSLTDMVIRSKKAHMVRQIKVLDDGTDEGLTAIARPLIDPDVGTVKVALVILLAHDAHILGPQIEKSKPIVVESFHRHI
jgi:hypothetical protein